MYVLHQGTVGTGFQFASGAAVGRANEPSPFSAGTIELQAPHFRARGFDLAEIVPGLLSATINVQLPYELELRRPDCTLKDIDWTVGQQNPAARIPPETFSFLRCGIAYNGYFHTGYIYYPHPETKPATNAHSYSVLEILAQPIDLIKYGSPIGVVCRRDAFNMREAGLRDLER